MKSKRLKMALILTVLLVLSVARADSNASQESVAKFEIFGPGLAPGEIVLPARYFFIKALDQNGNLIKLERPEELEVRLSGQGRGSKASCRYRSNLIERDDGLLIFRYRLLEECSNFAIDILYNGQPIGKSPYQTSHILPESCYCPIPPANGLVTAPM